LSLNVKKNGKENGIQRYQCVECKYRFRGKSKDKLTKRLWHDYVFGKQSFKQLSNKHKLTIKTIRKRVETIGFSYPQIKPGRVVLGIDTCFYGHEFGVVVFRGLIKGINLLWRFVNTENQESAISGINELRQKGWQILCLVVDGKNLSLGEKLNIPIQMCQFHQMMIIKRYLTANPRLLPSQQLKQIVKLLPITTEIKFIVLLEAWYFRWSDFLKEKTIDADTKRWFYTHKRTRSAYRSLRTNLPYLFTYQRLRRQGINYPNTNNSLEGSFAHLKDKVRLHRGLKLNRKLKLINQILLGKAPENYH
jgi:hypothetical protein